MIRIILYFSFESFIVGCTLNDNLINLSINFMNLDPIKALAGP
jgi:hypothetical protein